MPLRRFTSHLLAWLLALSLGCREATAPGLQSSEPSTPADPLPVPPAPAPPPAQTPPTPISPPSPVMTGWIWGEVLDSRGACVHQGVVEIIDGPGAGRVSNQPDGCDAWDEPGFEFDDLPIGATLTLRAKAPGYVSEVRQVSVPDRQAGVTPTQFVLVRK